jgi:hypothetical protein
MKALHPLLAWLLQLFTGLNKRLQYSIALLLTGCGFYLTYEAVNKASITVLFAGFALVAIAAMFPEE